MKTTTTEKQTMMTRSDIGIGDGSFDSIAWAFDVHAQTPDTGEYNAAVLVGNEDCPSRIEFYTQAEPLVTDAPTLVWENHND